jgi:hypothetical protein
MMQRLVGLASLACLVAPALPAQVSPADRAGFEGNSSTSYPLGRWNARVQQVHADVGAARTLRGHAYRRDAHATTAVGGFTSELEVTASVTTATPDRLGTRFADQIGPNPTVVLPRQRIVFPPTVRPLGEPAPVFQLRVPWTVAFSWPGQDRLCLDVVVWANSTASGNDRNFTANLDAHESFRDGRAEQPGYGYGVACTTLGGRAPTLELLVTRGAAGIALDVDAQCRLPSDANGRATAWLLLGAAPDRVDLSALPGCTLWCRGDLLLPLGDLDSAGRWQGSFPGLAPFPAGTRAFAQAIGWRAGDAQLALTPGVMATIPPAAPAAIPAARVAAADDRGAATGSVALSPAVVEFQ